MSRRPAERRTQHAVMASASEWARIRELAADAGMDISRYIVHRATVPDPLPDTGGPLHRLLSAATGIDILAVVRAAHYEDAGHAPSLGSAAGRPTLT